MQINTTFERNENGIVALIPDRNKPLLLVPAGSYGDAGLIEQAIRLAYAGGRKDERRQTAAIFRGLLGE